MTAIEIPSPVAGHPYTLRLDQLGWTSGRNFDVAVGTLTMVDRRTVRDVRAYRPAGGGPIAIRIDCMAAADFPAAHAAIQDAFQIIR